MCTIESVILLMQVVPNSRVPLANYGRLLLSNNLNLSSNSKRSELPLSKLSNDILYLLGDQLNIAVFSGTLVKMTCPVYSSLVHWTNHFYKVPEKHDNVYLVTLWMKIIVVLFSGTF